MISTRPLPNGGQFDAILVTGEVYIDHPLCGIGVIARVLENAGLSVGIIETPDYRSDRDFVRLGKPKLFFGISSGAIDSMLDNYTPMLKKRALDEHSKYIPKKPDRAVIIYANAVRKNFKDSPIVIGGVEASLRRFAHFDYWDNKMRKPILQDSRADILAYGNAEHSIVEIAKRLKENKPLDGIEGTCILRNSVPAGFETLPSFEDMQRDKKKFCSMQMMLSNGRSLAQKSGDKFVLQFRDHRYATEELDSIYELNYSRNIPKNAEYFRGMQFSVVTHRGCVGDCSFCSITLLQGSRIVSRSEGSILREIEKITNHRDFKGYIDDLGGPSANMYGMDCVKCGNDCLVCRTLDRSHSKLISLLRKARQIKGVKKIFVKSGVRFDLAADSTEYIRELSKHHVSGYLKIAPEHCSPNVLKLMNKYCPGKFEKFISVFESINKGSGQCLKYYVIAAHPGNSETENRELQKFVKRMGRDAVVQLFTPTPMSMSTCMYCTGLDPRTGRQIYVPRTFKEKKVQKNELMNNY